MQVNLFGTVLILPVLFSCENEPFADGHMNTWVLDDLFRYWKSADEAYVCSNCLVLSMSIVYSVQLQG